MTEFLGEDFLLPDESSRRLFHDYAGGEPILDYHCHLSPADIAADSSFQDLAQAWLGGDHYKWRAMRAAGIPESLIHAPGKESFLAWARTLPSLVGNPLHHWAHLELRRYFGIRKILDEGSAEAVWAECNERLAGSGFGSRALLRRMRVKAVCTTDDPADSLEWHASYAAYRASPGALPDEPVMVPTFRPDLALAVDAPLPWRAYLQRLGAAAGLDIGSYRSLVQALERRHSFFDLRGCRLSDHGLVQAPGRPVTEGRAQALFALAFAGGSLSPEEAEELKTSLLLEVGRMDARRGWTMQLHLAARRNLNTRALASHGPDTGYDSSNDPVLAAPLAAFLDALERDALLPKTILYSLNASDNALLADVMGCFQDGSPAGKMQLGPAWWFNDTMDGIETQLRVLSGHGLLARFVGMLTDSRSFLSFPRHEYFRRILCRLVGGWMERGEAPSDFSAMGGIVRDISYRNARAYFGLAGIQD